MSETAPQRNELMLAAADSIMRAVSGAFDQVFARPDAAAVVEGFLAGRVTFHIRRDGLEVLDASTVREVDGPNGDERPDPGMYL